jgi:hypothetical protein
MKKAIAFIVITGFLLVSGASTATAAVPTGVGTVKPQSAGGCDPATTYKDENDTYKFTQASGSGSGVIGGPGVTLTISRSTSFTVSDSVETTGGFTASIDIAAVNAAISPTVGVSFSGESTSSGAWTVPSSYTRGELEIGTDLHSGDVARWTTYTDCTSKKTATSNYKLPVHAWDFEHFKLN